MDSPPPVQTTSPPPPYPPTLPVDALEADADPKRIRAALRTLHARQNELDQARDTADLRGLMRVALQASSDAGMIGVLQVGRDEMPEAIKTLQRALERVVEREGVGAGASVDGVSVPSPVAVVKKVSIKEVTIPATATATATADDGDDHEEVGVRPRRQTLMSIESVESGSGGAVIRDTLDREFIESGIDALRRMSHGVGVDLPSWTITR